MTNWVNIAFKKIKRFSDKLDKKEILEDKTWCWLDNQQGYVTLTFSSDYRFFYSVEGSVTTGKWELLPNNSIFLDSDKFKIMLVQGVIFESILFLKREGKSNDINLFYDVSKFKNEGEVMQFINDKLEQFEKKENHIETKNISKKQNDNSKTNFRNNKKTISVKHVVLSISVLIVLFVLANFFSEDGENITKSKLNKNFTVSGTIADASNTKVSVEALSQQGTITVATGQTDASGKFEVTGNIPGMGLYQLRLGEAQDKAIPLTIVPDDYIKINTSFNDFSIKPNVSGPKWAKTMNEYMAIFAVFASKQQELSELQGKATEEELMEKYMEYRKPVDDFSIQKMKEDPSNPFNIILSTSVTPTAGFKNWDPKGLDVLKIVAEAYLKEYEGSPIAATMENQVYQIEMGYNEFIANSTGSKMAPEIALKNPQGKVIKLSSLRGKYVLIDFWASWCGPCRQENPNVVRLYNKYKNKGFTVYSVSLDKDAESWKRAISSDGLVWPNHVSDLLHWNSPMPSLYGFQGIPYTVLVDKEGKIIATGLRGPSLEQKLVELLGK